MIEQRPRPVERIVHHHASGARLIFTTRDGALSHATRLVHRTDAARVSTVRSGRRRTIGHVFPNAE
jgi:hypothetical protein